MLTDCGVGLPGLQECAPLVLACLPQVFRDMTHSTRDRISCLASRVSAVPPSYRHRREYEEQAIRLRAAVEQCVATGASETRALGPLFDLLEIRMKAGDGLDNLRVQNGAPGLDTIPRTNEPRHDGLTPSYPPPYSGPAPPHYTERTLARVRGDAYRTEGWGRITGRQARIYAL